MPERPVTPSDCALAIALPLSSEELLAELESEAPSDFVRGIRERYAATPLPEICDAYAREVAAIQRVIAGARALRMTVIPRAGLDDLARLTAGFHVVSVLAHAPTASIVAADVLDAPAFARAARAGGSADQRRVRRHLCLKGVDLGPSASPTPAAIAAVLDDLLWTRAPAARRRGQLDRTRVEDAFPGVMTCAPVIELADGLHPLRAVREAIAPAFDGVLDLSMCTSIILGEALKRTRTNFTALVTDRVTHPKMRLALYELWVEELGRARGPVRFTDLVAVIAEALMRAAGRR